MSIIVTSSASCSGREFILSLEELMDQLMEKEVQSNHFWNCIRHSPEQVPRTVYWGMCLENYHILAREALFDSPILTFYGNHNVRASLNHFYSEELGHDRLLLASLCSLDLSEIDVRNSVPLSTTWALIDGLSYWSRFDPLFFFTTLGVLEGREVGEDAFIGAAHKKQLSKKFIDPMMAHARINAVARHGEITREIFANISLINTVDQERIRELLPLFVTLYSNFYEGIWEHYSRLDDSHRPSKTFLRRLQVEL